jgi:hypothetical protein
MVAELSVKKGSTWSSLKVVTRKDECQIHIEVENTESPFDLGAMKASLLGEGRQRGKLMSSLATISKYLYVEVSVNDVSVPLGAMDGVSVPAAKGSCCHIVLSARTEIPKGA